MSTRCHGSLVLLLTLAGGCTVASNRAPEKADEDAVEAADSDGLGENDDTGPFEEPCDNTLDSDEDGLDDCTEIELGTALHLADTDGDGFSDYREVVELGFSPDNNNYKFNPLVADTPRIQVNITSPPSLALLYESSTGTELVHEVERSTESARSVTTGQESTNSHAIEYSTTMGASVTASASAGFPGGISGSVSATVSYESSLSTSTETSMTWSTDQTDENREGYAEAEALAESEGTTITGGVLAVTVDVENNGDIAYTLSNLAISAYMSTPGEAQILSPVGTLNFDTEFHSFPEFSYGPGQVNGPLVFLNDGLDTGTAESLLTDSTNLHLRVVAYELTDADGRSFTHNQTDIMARTATIIVDYEGEDTLLDSERYQVATNVDPDTLRVTAWDAMTEVLKLDYEMDDNRELLSVRDVANSNERNGYWTTVHKTSDGLTDTITIMNPDSADYDFGRIELKSGDVLHLVYVEDIDRDGLGRRQEKAYGTDIHLADTDADGLGDGEEVNVTKTNPLVADTDADGILDGDEPGLGLDPLVADTDEDGLLDGEELALGTDPLLADTDADGLLDGEERALGTDPLLEDTDADCLTDAEEVFDSASDPLVFQDGICTPISDPSSSVHSSRTVEFSNVTFNGSAATLFFAAPGESIDLAADWSVTSASSVYCPGCIVQYYLGITDVFSTCFTSRGYGNNASASGSLSETFSAPADPGVYYLTRHNTFDYECKSVTHSEDFSRAAATVVVLNP